MLCCVSVLSLYQSEAAPTIVVPASAIVTEAATTASSTPVIRTAARWVVVGIAAAAAAVRRWATVHAVCRWAEVATASVRCTVAAVITATVRHGHAVATMATHVPVAWHLSLCTPLRKAGKEAGNVILVRQEQFHVARPDVLAVLAERVLSRLWVVKLNESVARAPSTLVDWVDDALSGSQGRYHRNVSVAPWTPPTHAQRTRTGRPLNRSRISRSCTINGRPLTCAPDIAHTMALVRGRERSSAPLATRTCTAMSASGGPRLVMS